MNVELENSATATPGERVLHRIELLTLSFGFVAAVVAVSLHRPDWAKGLGCGAIMAWLNFRWLSRGIRAMMLLANAQVSTLSSGSEVPVNAAPSTTSALLTYLALVFRYALVAAGVYVIFIYLRVPLVSIGLGLCSFVAAILAASVWEILNPEA